MITVTYNYRTGEHKMGIGRRHEEGRQCKWHRWECDKGSGNVWKKWITEKMRETLTWSVVYRRPWLHFRLHRQQNRRRRRSRVAEEQGWYSRTLEWNGRSAGQGMDWADVGISGFPTARDHAKVDNIREGRSWLNGEPRCIWKEEGWVIRVSFYEKRALRKTWTWGSKEWK